MGAVLLALLPSFAVGYLVARGCRAGSASGGWRGAFDAALGLGLGLGAGSWTYFVWAVGVGPSRPGFVAAELVFYIALAVAILATGWSRDMAPAPAAPPHEFRTWPFRAAFGLVLVIGLVSLGLQVRQRPYGDIDAWQIWNLHARTLFRGGERWPESLARLDDWSHPDYPLLLPATVARGWTYAGRESTLAPQLVAALFAAATVALLTAGLAMLRTPAQGWLGGIVLLATPSFLRLTADQYADVPLGFSLLASALLFEAEDRLPPGNARLPLIAGLATGMAAWTKNEGLLFLVATLVGRVVVALAEKRKPRSVLREAMAFAAGLVPFAGAVAYFKLALAAPNDLLAGQRGGATWPRLLSLERYALVGGEMTAALARLGNGALWVLAVYRVLLGPAARSAGRGLHTGTVLVVMLAGYAVVYLITPLDLALHLGLSVDRLYLQLWPCALLWFFLNVAAPEERLAGESTAPSR